MAYDEWGNWIDEYSERFTEDPYTMERLMYGESRGNPNAVSPAGARGLFQLMPATADYLDVENPFSPRENTRGGIQYFSEMKDKFGEDPALADIAYNWGPGNLQELIDREGTDDINELYPHLPEETKGHLYNTLKPSTGDLDEEKPFKTPIPKLPDLDPASKYARTEFENASLPSTDRRQRDLSRIAEEVTGLEETKTEALQELRGRGQLETEDAIALVLSSILPTLFGWASGGQKGAAIGAEAGREGASVGLPIMLSQMNKRDNVNQILYSDAKQQIKEKQAEARSVRDAIADREERNDELNWSYGQGGYRRPIGAQQYSPEISSALAKIAKGEELNEAETAAIYSSPRAVDDMNEIKKRADIAGRSNANIELKGRIPTPELAKITGNEVAVNNYKELARLVQGKDVNPDRISAVLGEVQQELLDRGNDKFTADGYDGLFNRVLAKSGLDPNSYDYKVLNRMKQIGRANAIAQPGVATNEDALQEIGFVSIKPGQTIQAYLENLAELSENRTKVIAVTLDNLETNGYPAAKRFKEKYYGSGLIPRPSGTTPTQTSGTMPQTIQGPNGKTLTLVGPK